LLAFILQYQKGKKHPQASIFITAAIGVSFIVILLNQLITSAGQYFAAENTESSSFLLMAYLKHYGKIPYLNTIAWILILFSVFGSRPPEHSAEKTDVTKIDP
jgi:hypothetical protein